tara:strand:+ start:2225 stop:2419 length:195 start_codon:yes stop_codon:yes gene_type:complete
MDKLKKEYFVEMTISHGFSVIAESEEEAIPIAKKFVYRRLVNGFRHLSAPKIDILNVVFKPRIR